MDVGGPAHWQKITQWVLFGFCLRFVGFGFYFRFTYDSDTTIFKIVVGFENVLEEKNLNSAPL